MRYGLITVVNVSWLMNMRKLFVSFSNFRVFSMPAAVVVWVSRVSRAS